MASSTRKDPQIVYQGITEARCLACGHKGELFVVSTTSKSTGLNIFIFCLFTLACACCLLDGNGIDSSLSFFCQRCGLRLISECNAPSKVKYVESDLIPNQAISGKAAAVPGANVVKSPVGRPVAANKDWIIKTRKRYSNLKPVRKLGIIKGRYKIPSLFNSLTPEFPTSYTIGTPGMADEQPADKKNHQYLQSSSCSWNRYSSGPHFQVFMQSKGTQLLEIGQVHLRGITIGDVDIKVLDSQMVGRKSWSSYQMYAEEENAWSLCGAGVLWHSSQGVLLWNWRKITSDGDGAKGRVLCLLDSYDRLVTAVWKTKRSDSEAGDWWEMRVYVDISDDYLGEIIASYVAVRVQTERIAQEHIYDSS
ncbi:hypothetical protein KAF25_003959 [Fusarium avenaceum]|uniref:LITAF domain-containing protein n=1 Tax=Fusarium avenaceum TaxID=40199 RepID=A0A9P7H9Z1_9HYPO|nr:hypothetical protein KAF25_003959 [Fusarium avenaceum]